MEILQIAVDKLSNSMRIYIEEKIRFDRLFQTDSEEAINNLDRAFEAKLEAFHSVYDVSKDKFNYFDHADTALLILLRNAIHHRNHLLFRSWNSEMHLNSGMKKYSGGAFLLVNHADFENSTLAQQYYKIDDFLDRLDSSRSSEYIDTNMNKKNKEKLITLLNDQLKFNDILNYAKSERYPSSQIYLNLIPIFISALSKVYARFKQFDFKVKGYDSDVYFETFTTEKLVDINYLSYKELRLP